MKRPIYKLLTTGSWLGSRAQSILFVLVLFLLSACEKEVPSVAAPTVEAQENQTDLKLRKPDIIVKPGHSIQAALDAAEAGDLILILPGTYREALHVNKPNITLFGSPFVVVENPGAEEDGLFVGGRRPEPSNADGFELYNITFRGFKENGVFLLRVNDFVLSHITTINCGEYGLFPLFSNDGLIEYCTASGHSDTGIYVGQSENIRMNYNRAFANVNGLEIENCSHVVARHNVAYDNTAGFLVVLLPGLTVTTSTDIVLEKNQAYRNNHVNFAEPGGGFESVVPSGCGILIVGTDNTRVSQNRVQDNNFLGIAVVSTRLLGELAHIPQKPFC
ncbi:parallel beta-helix domain-containing protein [Hymenobacter volaticus]|uniref:Right-handed parallel beta-helix repeat-containing protein n=1 Tax=Hymenobacter volaticus TaxID=2932254 RepID=A0ABY4GEL4_9BACT|nr:parallel beta-helix domain-containing protein [Hymenobacter volaticus]UOQ68829.1 right-handed parallel beta-helix repeat-containing protein [Hymenobacter volaticus]